MRMRSNFKPSQFQ
uniref:Rps18 n=1 Tax=Arundo donax TaxID=35708 RepID=A0A0A8YFW9_ARUDO